MRNYNDSECVVHKLGNWFFGVVGIGCLIWAVVALTGCNTESRAIRQTTHAYDNYPGVVASLTSKWFPVQISTVVKEHYTEGKKDTVYGQVVDCDSVARANGYVMPANQPAATVKTIVQRMNVPCPPSIFIHDTLQRDSTVYQEKTQYQQMLADTTKALDTLRGSYVSEKHFANWCFWIAIGLAAIIVATVIIRLRFPKLIG